MTKSGCSCCDIAFNVQNLTLTMSGGEWAGRDLPPSPNFSQAGPYSLGRSGVQSGPGEVGGRTQVPSGKAPRARQVPSLSLRGRVDKEVETGPD